MNTILDRINTCPHLRILFCMMTFRDRTVISDKYIHHRSKDDRLLFPTEASTVSGDLCIDRKSAFPAQPASEVGQVVIAETK